MTCDTIHLTPQYQLQFAWGGKYGGANCSACSGGQLAQIASCGKYLFTGAQIRAASNEPIPDPDSPGLNHSQVAVAVYKLSGGKVVLQVLNGYDFASAKRRSIEGAPFDLSIRRSVLVARGQGYGNGFGGNHDITVYVDGGRVHFADPLTGIHPTDWTTLSIAAAALVVNNQGDIAGSGRAWVMFGADITSDLTAVIAKRTELYAYRSGGNFLPYGGVFSGTYATKRVPGDFYRISIGGKTLYLAGIAPRSNTGTPVPQLNVTWHLKGG